MPSINHRPLAGTWIAPEAGCLKFNVDAVVRGSFGEAGIGGVLRDQCGKILMQFSKSIGRSDPTGAELAAIFEACQCCVVHEVLRAARRSRVASRRLAFQPLKWKGCVSAMRYGFAGSTTLI
ncbi:hypothetical protein V6N11_075284 [Hibiscus sabdariffa]|uniref:RNase H type-1 domain-containing protein n=1 Tax=Hibiscus sabdariffa TaxID=183260 RepID=A0ABR2R629_9ROSI